MEFLSREKVWRVKIAWRIHIRVHTAQRGDVCG
jgi:hypothetical protein